MPWMGAVAVLETDNSTPYFLNLHNGEVAHTLILGMSGSGKSYLCVFLLQNAQKYEPLTFIFDNQYVPGMLPACFNSICAGKAGARQFDARVRHRYARRNDGSPGSRRWPMRASGLIPLRHICSRYNRPFPWPVFLQNSPYYLRPLRRLILREKR